MSKKIKTICLALALIIALAAALSACVSKPANNAANNNTAEEPSLMDTELNISVGNLLKLANKSSGIWELMCYMFPDYAVHRSSGSGFTLEPVNTELSLNKYNWEDRSNAVKGIDVSAYQKNIDWIKVAESNEVGFAFLRIGYRGYGTGKIVMDSKFIQNATGATGNGIPIGVYFVTKAINPEEAREEALWIIDNIKDYDVTWPVVMDFESAKDQTDRTWGMKPEMRTEIIISFCETLKEAGYTPMLYGGIGTYMTKMDITKLDAYNKWFAMYFNTPHFPYEFQIWQATDSGKIDGIPVSVDIDYAMFNYTTGKDAVRGDTSQNIHDASNLNNNSGIDNANGSPDGN